jgi:hypothetical protein
MAPDMNRVSSAHMNLHSIPILAMDLESLQEELVLIISPSALFIHIF